MPFEKNIFINCPFDTGYRPLLKTLLFCVLYLEHEPKIAETRSSSDVRITRIKSLIRNSKFGIHDLSRKFARQAGEMARFNMPFELGLDIGCQEFGSDKFRKKKTLVLDSGQHDYDASLSDISGQDIASHLNDERKLVSIVRDWLSRNYPKKPIVTSQRIWTDYNKFTYYLSEKFSKDDLDQMQMRDYIKEIKSWIHRPIIT